MCKPRCDRALTKAHRCLSPRNCDCFSVLSRAQARTAARLPAHKSRFYGYPDKSRKECIFWCPGQGRWCYKCSVDAHFPVPIPTHKHSPAHRARTHKIDAVRSRHKHSQSAHFPVPTNAMSGKPQAPCKNGTCEHPLCSSRQRGQSSKRARSPPTFTCRLHESHETFSDLPRSDKHCSGVEDERVARCIMRAPRLKCHRRNAYASAPRSAAVAQRTERASHPTPSRPCRRMGRASRGFGLGARHYKERLLATVLSAPSTLHSARRNYGEFRSSTPASRRNIKTVEQRGDTTCIPSSKRRGAIQQILPSPQKGRWYQTHTRSKTTKQSFSETQFQNAHDQQNPRAHSPRRLVYVDRSKGRVFPNTDSVTPQAILEIRLRGSGIPVYSPAIRLVPGTPYIYEVHGRSARPPQTQGHASAELFGRLADHSSITISARGAQNHVTRSPRESWYHDQLDEELPEPQPNYIVSGHRSGLLLYDGAAVATARAAHTARSEVLPLRCDYPAQTFSEDAGPHGLSIISSPAGPASHAPSAVLVESASATRSVGTQPIAPQSRSRLRSSPETMGGGRLVPFRCKPGDFLESESGVYGRIHLGMGSAARGQAVLWPLVRTRKAPSYQLPGNASSSQRADALLSPHQGPTRRSPLGQHGRGVLHKSPRRPRFQFPLQAGRAPPNMGSAQPELAESGACARDTQPGPDRLSRNNVPTGEWSLHPQTVRLLWRRFGRAEVDLFASPENAHCPVFFSKNDSALSRMWPRCPLYAFPPISLLPQVLERVRETKCSVLLVAPFWKNQAWFPVLMQLADIAPWPVPLRRDLLSQAGGSIWHPHPELWSLHVWALNGYPLISQRE